MRATNLEFRLRMLINAAIIVLGFWAPWVEAWGINSRISTWEWLALGYSHHSPASFSLASAMMIIAAACIAGLGAMLRVWGTAYLGPGTVAHPEMQAGAVTADGPYRIMRNPLYLGLWCMTAALAFLMPPTGALVTLILISIFLLRLILAEEAFLSAKIGEPYRDYLQSVPRLLPRVRPGLLSAGGRPQWLKALLSELTPIGVFVALAFLSWTYDNRLMVRVILISFGVSLVVRAIFLTGRPGAQAN